MRYYYLPPEEIDGEPAKPLRIEYGGGYIVFESPHKFHKWVEEEYDVGIIVSERTGQPKLDPATGQPARYKAKRKKYVLDVEKNELFEKGEIGAPINYADINADVRAWIARSRHAPENAFLKSDAEVKDIHDREMERMREQQRVEISKLKAELERERAEAQAAIDKEKLAARAKRKGE